MDIMSELDRETDSQTVIEAMDLNNILYTF
jgi:hypothetical protein